MAFYQLGANEQSEIAKQKVEGENASLASVVKKEKRSADLVIAGYENSQAKAIREELEALELENENMDTNFTVYCLDCEHDMEERTAREAKIKELKIKLAKVLIKDLKAKKVSATDEEVNEAIAYQEAVIEENTADSDSVLVAPAEAKPIKTPETAIAHPLASMLIGK